jgi:hypothetical protein
MRMACAGALDTARELLEFGVLCEGARELVALRRCAVRCDCGDWEECRFRIEGAWATPERARPATRERHSARKS